MENKIEFAEYVINGKKYRLNVFETANTKEDNYLLGYLLGDGGYNAETHKRNARLFVSSTEKYIVEYFLNMYQPDSSIDSRIPVNNTRNIVSTIYSHKFTFSSKFSNTFKKYGILSVKKQRTFHNIKKEFMPNLLLGLFDSDGCISWGRRKDRNRLWSNITITHQSINMLLKLQRYLNDELNISTYVSPKGEEDCFVLRTSNMDSVVKLLHYMYDVKPNIYNVTKYSHAVNFIKEFTN